MAGLSPTPKQQIFGSDGAPLVGGKIYTYAAGTSTPATTYTDYSAGTANTNPIILDSYGQANIWLLTSTSYKFIVKTATDVLLYTVDNISTPLDISAFAAPPPIGSTTPNTGAFTTGAFTSLTASGAFTLTGNGAMKLNAGTTAERPTPSNGMLRYNTSTLGFEGYVNGAWTNVFSGTPVTSVATGTGLTGGPVTSTGTISIDSTVVTLTGTQTLSNKTIQGGGLTSGTAVATTSGTAVGFTGIPSWAKRITLLLNVVSTSGANNLLVQIGSGSYTTTGYVSTAFYATTTPSTDSVTNGFVIRSDNAGNNIAGAMVLTSFGSNTWVETWTGGSTVNNQVMVGGGLVTLSGVLDRIQLITTSTDNFDSGSVNILYE
jgi:hypothetical protein